MKKISLAIVGTILSVVSISSFAQNSNVVKDPALVTTNSQTNLYETTSVSGVVTQIGTPSSHPSHAKELKGFANDLPLITVMKQITPNGWIVKKSDTEESKLDTQKVISWQGGKTWFETLEVISKNYNINAQVDWDNKVITVSNAVKTTLVVKPKKSIFELEGTQVAQVETEPKKVSDVVVGSSEIVQVETAVAQVKSVEAKPVVHEWDISSAKTLKENVAVWAEKSGYRLVWTAEDYPVVDSKIIAGEFDSENGPIKQLSVDYGPESRVQTPISFQFYQNKTVVVENWMFEQSGYPQYSKKVLNIK